MIFFKIYFIREKLFLRGLLEKKTIKMPYSLVMKITGKNRTFTKKTSRSENKTEFIII